MISAASRESEQPNSCRERSLARRELRAAAGRVLVRVLRCAGNEAPVTGHQQLKGLLGGGGLMSAMTAA